MTLIVCIKCQTWRNYFDTVLQIQEFSYLISHLRFLNATHMYQLNNSWTRQIFKYTGTNSDLWQWTSVQWQFYWRIWWNTQNWVDSSKFGFCAIQLSVRKCSTNGKIAEHDLLWLRIDIRVITTGGMVGGNYLPYPQAKQFAWNLLARKHKRNSETKSLRLVFGSKWITEMQGYDSGINIHHQQCTEYMYAGWGSCSGFIFNKIHTIGDNFKHKK